MKAKTTEEELILISQRIRALSQTGLVYSENDYDIERYQDLLNLSHKMTALLTDNKPEDIKQIFRLEDDYVTPKVDVRAVVFNERDEILLVKERADGGWAIPGGWADVGFTPNEIAVKEVKEESGLDIEPVRLLAVLDKKCHYHPPHLHYAYKIFIQCKIVGGSFTETFDILDKGFFRRNALPSLSTERNTKEQIDLMFEYNDDQNRPAITD